MDRTANIALVNCGTSRLCAHVAATVAAAAAAAAGAWLSAVRVSAAGHRFCRQCMERARASGGSRCAYCRQNYVGTVPTFFE